MKLSTKQSKFASNLAAENTFMLTFIFPCGKAGQRIKDENNLPCESCKILPDCIDYYSSSPNQQGKTLSFKDFIYHRERLKNRKVK